MGDKRVASEISTTTELSGLELGSTASKSAKRFGLQKDKTQRQSSTRARVGTRQLPEANGSGSIQRNAGLTTKSEGAWLIGPNLHLARDVD